jgi:hypothetical protein
MSKLTVCFATLCMLAAPAAATPSQAPPVVEKAGDNAPTKRAASGDELQQYAAREELAKKLEKFEGGRGRGAETGTIIIILLVVIIVLIVV